MAPPAQRRQISKDRFSALFGALKTQAYVDPVVRPALSYMYEAPHLSLILRSLAEQPFTVTEQYPGMPRDRR